MSSYRFYGDRVSIEEAELAVDSEGNVVKEADNVDLTQEETDDRTLYQRVIDEIDSLESHENNVIDGDEPPPEKVLREMYELLDIDFVDTTWALEDAESAKKGFLKEVSDLLSSAVKKAVDLVKSIFNKFKTDFPKGNKRFEEVAKRSKHIRKRLETKKLIEERDFKLRSGSMILINGMTDPLGLLDNVNLYSIEYLEKPAFLNHFDDILSKVEEVMKNTNGKTTFSEIVTEIMSVSNNVEYGFPFKSVKSKDSAWKQWDFDLSDNVIVNVYERNGGLGAIPKPPTVTLRAGDAVVKSATRDELEKILDRVDAFAAKETKCNDIIKDIEDKFKVIDAITNFDLDDVDTSHMLNQVSTEGWVKRFFIGATEILGSILKGALIVIRLIITAVVLGIIAIVQMFLFPFYGVEGFENDTAKEMALKSRNLTMDRLTELAVEKYGDPAIFSRSLEKANSEFKTTLITFVDGVYNKSLNQIFKAVSVSLDYCDKSLG